MANMANTVYMINTFSYWKTVLDSYNAGMMNAPMLFNRWVMFLQDMLPIIYNEYMSCNIFYEDLFKSQSYEQRPFVEETYRTISSYEFLHTGHTGHEAQNLRMITLYQVLSRKDIFGLNCLKQIAELTEKQKDFDRKDAEFLFHIKQCHNNLERTYVNNYNNFVSCLIGQQYRNKCTSNYYSVML